MATELVGRPVEDLVPAGAAGTHVALRSRHLAAHPPPDIEARTVSAQRRDGSVFPAEVAVSSVVDDSSTLVLAAVRDVTERSELEEQRRRRVLEAAQERTDRLESLGRLAGGVAHDFNNLLGVILNYATLLGHQQLPGQARADVAEIQAAAGRAAELTGQLLAFARRDPTQPERVDLNESVHSVGELFGRTVGAGLDVVVDLSPTQPVVVVDRHQLDQVLLNLATNAADALGGRGRLTISTRTDPTGTPATVVLEVADTGPGMDPEVAARAFEPFFTTKPRGQGTGLGLAAVYGIVQRAGGEVTIDSTPGSGTTVSIRLPLVDQLPDAPAAPRDPAGPAGQGQLILVVEDDSALRAATQRVLEAAGYRVLRAAGGAEALSLISSAGEPVAAVLTDVAMSPMGGGELAGEIRRLAPGVPVVMTTGYSPGGAPAGHLVVPKPAGEGELLRAIRAALGGP